MSNREIIPFGLERVFASLTLALCCVPLHVSNVAHAKDAVILHATSQPIRIGTASRFAQFKVQLERRLQQCRSDAASLISDAPGIFGQGTAQAIREVLNCKDIVGVSGDSPAWGGALTVSIWNAIMGPEPPPTLDDRVETLTLSFEGTDFSERPEWNFCQDSPSPRETRAEEAARGGQCYNIADPCSMLTWGPRGATVGQGGEIRWVLWKVWQAEPSLIAEAFGPEIENVRRFLRLRGPPVDRCTGTTPLEHFMCAVWIDPTRRRAWEEGLIELGRSSFVRSAYRQIYAGHDFDGYKLRDYYRLWQKLGIVPSEIDYAFFFDRATHIGGPPLLGEDTIAKLRACIKEQRAAKTKNAAARRCLSLQHPHSTQPVDRLGRDVAYYLDGFAGHGLTKRELDTWGRHIPVAASRNFGLSDRRPHPLERILLLSDAKNDPPPQDSSLLSEVERTCPRSILSPLRTLPPEPPGSRP